MKGLIIAATKSAVLELSAGLRRFCDSTVLIATSGPDAAVNANKAYVMENMDSVVTGVSAVKDLIAAEEPNVVFVQQSTDGRFLAAAAAAQLGTSVFADCSEFAAEEGKFTGVRMTYGGSALQTQQTSGKAVFCFAGGAFEPEAETPCESIETISVNPAGGIKVTAKKEKQVASVNLTAAKKVVGVGRGIGSLENIELAQKLAKAIGGEIACTRPVSEEENWLPRERYVGVSGLMLKPELYIALGISGQIQHTVGVNQSGTVICINKDKDAPMFRQSDYGLVGNVEEILPKLIELLS